MFELLVRFLSNCREFASQRPPREHPPLPCGKQLLIALWILSTQETYRSVSDRFGVCKASAHRSVRRVVGAINNNLTYRLIRWPSGDGAVYVMEGFERRCGMKHILGAIDGSHIQ